MLFVVATPIGHLDDISKRAIQTLHDADLILAEDTRHSKKLLDHYEIKTPLQAYHEHNEATLTPKIIEQLQAGKNIALISDAGTPLISDPGFNLVREAAKHNLTVSPLPGACAAIAALSVSGLPTDKFLFAGFLPAKSKGRIDKLNALKQTDATLVLYESTHRIEAALTDIATVFGETPVVLAKEISKQFERVFHGTAQEILTTLAQDPKLTQGEFVVIIAPYCGEQSSVVSISPDALLTQLAKHLPKSKAAEVTAKLTGLKKRDLYQTLI